ncbi:MAG: hypothetical protein R3F30_15065, partial [Planctomycetota bacterium]
MAELRLPSRRHLVAAGLTLLLGSATVHARQAKVEQGDPSKGEVPLPAAKGWDARLLIDNGKTGIWTVKAFPVFRE